MGTFVTRSVSPFVGDIVIYPMWRGRYSSHLHSLVIATDATADSGFTSMGRG